MCSKAYMGWQVVGRTMVEGHSIVNTNTCTLSLVKIYLKHLKKTPTCFGLRPSSGSYNVLAKVTII